MNLDISMQSLKHVFSFPFADPKWKDKFLTGSLLAFGGFVVPVISWLPVLGYTARLIRAGARNTDPAALPEWDDWGDLFSDGLRLFGASLILLLPSILIMTFGWIIYTFSMIGIQNASRYGSSAGPVAGFLIGFFVFFISIGIGSLLGMISSLVMTPAGAHVAYHKRFGALFEVGAWWKIFRANLGGFLLTLFITLGLGMALTIAMQILYLTIILCMVIPLVTAPLYFYMMVIYGRISGQAYGEALEKAQPAAQTTALLPDAA